MLVASIVIGHSSWSNRKYVNHSKCDILLYALLNIGILAYFLIAYTYLPNFSYEVFIFALNIALAIVVGMGGGFLLYIKI